MALSLDTAEESQAHRANTARSIYDAGTGEIFWKSLLAGFSLGLGRAFATLLFFGLLFGLFLRFFQPILDTYFPELQQFNRLLEQSLETIPTPNTETFGSTSTTPTVVGE